MAKKREDIGVYFFEGFLEGGKTTYIQSLISDPQLPEDLRIPGDLRGAAGWLGRRHAGASGGAGG